MHDNLESILLLRLRQWRSISPWWLRDDDGSSRLRLEIGCLVMDRMSDGVFVCVCWCVGYVCVCACADVLMYKCVDGYDMVN